MKRKLLLILAALFLLIAGIQNAMAQKVTLYAEGNKAYECSVSQLDSIVFSEAPATIETEEIVVTIDANGNADGGHIFTIIDRNNFYIDDIKYTAVSGDLEVTGYDKAFFKGAAKIINKLIYQGRHMNVTSIAKEAFYGCKVLTAVTIPNSVTSIGESAFSGCSGLTSVTIPNSVTSIYGSTFADCSSLTSIKVETGNTKYDSRNNCNAIIETATNTLIAGCKNTVIPNSVTSIGEYAFQYCSGLTSITIPESVTSIDYSAFNSCTSLTSVTLESDAIVSASSTSMKSIFGDQVKTYIIGDAVKSIGSSAFSGCSSLTSVTIPNSVTSIGSSAFYGCRGLTSITIPNSVTRIDYQAFSGCSSLTSITIPNSVTIIGISAFYGCSSLTSVTIPNSVTIIGDFAFQYCSGLKDVYCLAESVPQTASNAFYNSPISSATLHVPAASIDAYKTTSPWSSFRTIVAIQ